MVCLHMITCVHSVICSRGVCVCARALGDRVLLSG